MRQESDRERSGSELVFAVLKALMVAYHLWGAESGLKLSELSGALGTSESRLGGLLTDLIRDGLVALDVPSGTVRLTVDGARDLLATPAR